MNRLTAAVAAALALPLGLTGCTASPDDTRSVVAAAVSAADPAITDVFVTTGSGLAGTSIRVRVYIEPEDTAGVARILDASLQAILVGAPERPASFAIDVAEGAKPSTVNLNAGSIDLEDAARAVGLYEHYSDDTLTGATDVLEERYGRWEDVHK
jgi:hypothetical protein